MGTGGAGIGAGTLAAAGVQYQLHIPGKERGQRGFNILGAGKKGQLLVRKLQDMGQGEKLPHGLAQLLPVRPEGEAEVGVKAEDGSRLPRGSDGSQMGVAHGTVHQRDAAKVQGKRLRKPARIDLLRGVQQVCGGLAAEAEGALAVFC